MPEDKQSNPEDGTRGIGNYTQKVKNHKSKKRETSENTEQSNDSVSTTKAQVVSIVKNYNKQLDSDFNHSKAKKLYREIKDVMVSFETMNEEEKEALTLHIEKTEEMHVNLKKWLVADKHIEEDVVEVSNLIEEMTNNSGNEKALKKQILALLNKINVNANKIKDNELIKEYYVLKGMLEMQ